MHFVHSLWTKPMILNRRDIEFKLNIIVNTFCTATSVAYILHNGGQINLYTDGFGQDLLEYLPYNNIYKLHIRSAFPPSFWACGKFLALEKMDINDVHIDGDVFLKSDKLIDKICDTSYDVVIQSIEDDEGTLKDYYNSSREILQQYNIKPLTCSLDEMPSFNCGVIGFNNIELKLKYLNEYFNTLSTIIKNKECLSVFEHNKMLIPDLILEQQFLYELAKDYNVNNILGNSKTMYENAIKLNYQHILGGYKLELLDNIKNELKFVDYDLYNKTIKQLKYLL